MAETLYKPQDVMILHEAGVYLELPYDSLGMNLQRQIVPVSPMIYYEGRFLGKHDRMPDEIREPFMIIQSAARYLTSPHTKFNVLTEDVRANAVDLFHASRYLYFRHRIHKIILPWQIEITSGSNHPICSDTSITAWVPPLESMLSSYPLDQTGHPKPAFKRIVYFEMNLITPRGDVHSHVVDYKE